MSVQSAKSASLKKLFMTLTCGVAAVSLASCGVNAAEGDGDSSPEASSPTSESTQSPSPTETATDDATETASPTDSPSPEASEDASASPTDATATGVVRALKTPDGGSFTPLPADEMRSAVVALTGALKDADIKPANCAELAAKGMSVPDDLGVGGGVQKSSKVVTIVMISKDTAFNKSQVEHTAMMAKECPTISVTLQGETVEQTTKNLGAEGVGDGVIATEISQSTGATSTTNVQLTAYQGERIVNFTASDVKATPELVKQLSELAEQALKAEPVGATA